MGSIWEAVRWWDVWQMRILMSGSLFIQWFLLLAAPMRKYTVPGVLRKLIWLAYISCDALAIYALATLFNRQAKASSPCHVGYSYRASSIEVLWAPILLIHLGGREEITAFDIEDNELWTRQTVTLVSQVTVAIYAFYKTWPSSGDNRLLWSAILLFVVGILSFCEKPWALRRASINRLVAVSSLAAGRRTKPTGCEYLCTELKADDMCRLIMCCGNNVNGNRKPQQHGDEEEDEEEEISTTPILTELDKVQMILSDLSLLSADIDLASRGQKRSAKSVLERVEAGGERNMKHWLSWAFGLIYTRANVIWTPAYMACHLVLVPCLHVAAITLFATSHKQAYRQFNAVDVRMTYIVLCLTAVLDVFGLLISEFIIYRVMALQCVDIPALCATLPGHNLIDGALESKRLMRRLRDWLGCRALGFSKRDLFSNRYLKVAGMVLLDLLDSGKSLRGLDLASYRSPNRDENWTLGKLDASTFQTAIGGVGASQSQMAKSLRVLPFDVSVLRWHIATDLCFRSSRPPADSSTSWRARTGEEMFLHRDCAQGISNYMAHLLYSRANMLMTGSRQHLFVEAMKSTGHLLNQPPPLDELRVAKFMEDATATAEYPDVREACTLAMELMELPEATRWELMYRVWMGMLCYSASMCRGYLHAKSLGEGGEFLSFVSIIIALKGGKTLADKLQMPDHVGTQDQEETSAATTTQH